MIVFHGTTPEFLPAIQRDGLAPGTYAADTRELAHGWAWQRALARGSDACVILELDVPDAAVMEIEEWWWAQGQRLLPAGCPASCIVSVEHSEAPPYSAEWWAGSAEAEPEDTG